jgi:large subunit ribosomal protein L25
MSINVLVKDIQDDILTDKVKHIDFYAIHAGQKLNTQVPVHWEGSPIGVREGGILEHKIEELEVICLPKDIPAFFTVDISGLAIGDSLHVGDIAIPEGVEVKNDPTETLVVVSHAQAIVEPEEEGEGEDEMLEGEEAAAEESAEE